MNTIPTKDQTKAALSVLMVVAEAIRDLGEVPSSHLYAVVMNHLSLESYQKCLALLKKAELVTETGHLLRWTGPKA